MGPLTETLANSLFAPGGSGSAARCGPEAHATVVAARAIARRAASYFRIKPKHVSKDETDRDIRLALPLVTETALIDDLLIANLEANRLTQLRRFRLAALFYRETPASQIETANQALTNLGPP